MSNGWAKEIACIRGGHDALAVHPDGWRLVVATMRGKNRVIEIRTLDDPTPGITLRLPQRASLLWNPDGSQLAATGLEATNKLYVWNFHDPEPHVLEIKSGGLVSFYNVRGDLLATNGWAGMPQLWYSRTWREVFQTPMFSLKKFSRDGRHIAGWRWGESLRFY